MLHTHTPTDCDWLRCLFLLLPTCKHWKVLLPTLWCAALINYCEGNARFDPSPADHIRTEAEASPLIKDMAHKHMTRCRRAVSLKINKLEMLYRIMLQTRRMIHVGERRHSRRSIKPCRSVSLLGNTYVQYITYFLNAFYCLNHFLIVLCLVVYENLFFIFVSLLLNVKRRRFPGEENVHTVFLYI